MVDSTISWVWGWLYDRAVNVEVSRDVDAAPDRVWEVVTDLERAAERMSAIESIEVLEGPGAPLDVGTRWRETRMMFGKSATEEMVVTDVRDGRSYTTAADGKGAYYTSVISVAPRGAAGATVSMSLGAEPKGLGSRVLAATIGRLFVGPTTRAIGKDLDDVAAAAEEA